MGVWSRAVYTNKPEAIVERQWFSQTDSPGYILKHYALSYLEDMEETFTMKDLLECVHENSKIWGHMAMDQRLGWDDLLKKVLERNPEIDVIEIHFYCLDDEMPYYFYLERGENKRSMMKVMPMGHLFYSKRNGRSKVTFVDEKYIKNYKNIHVPIDYLVPDHRQRNVLPLFF